MPSCLTRQIVQVLTEVLHGHIEDSSDDLPAVRFISRATPFGSATSTCFATPLRGAVSQLGDARNDRVCVAEVADLRHLESNSFTGTQQSDEGRQKEPCKIHSFQDARRTGLCVNQLYREGRRSVNNSFISHVDFRRISAASQNRYQTSHRRDTFQRSLERTVLLVEAAHELS